MSKEIFKYDMCDLSCQGLAYFFHNKVNDNNIHCITRFLESPFLLLYMLLIKGSFHLNIRIKVVHV